MATSFPFPPPTNLCKQFVNSQSLLSEHFQLTPGPLQDTACVFSLKLSEVTLVNHVLLLPSGKSLATVMGSSVPEPCTARVEMWCDDLLPSIFLPHDKKNKISVGHVVKLSPMPGSIQDSLAYLGPFAEYGTGTSTTKSWPHLIITDRIIIAGCFEDLTVCVIGKALSKGQRYKLPISRYLNQYRYSGCSSMTKNLDSSFVLKSLSNTPVDMPKNDKNIAREDIFVECKENTVLRDIPLPGIGTRNENYEPEFNDLFIEFCKNFRPTNNHVNNFWNSMMSIIEINSDLKRKAAIESCLSTWCGAPALQECSHLVDQISMTVFRNFKGLGDQSLQKLLRVLICFYAGSLDTANPTSCESLISEFITSIETSRVVSRLAMTSCCELASIWLTKNPKTALNDEVYRSLTHLVDRVATGSLDVAISSDNAECLNSLCAMATAIRAIYNIKLNSCKARAWIQAISFYAGSGDSGPLFTVPRSTKDDFFVPNNQERFAWSKSLTTDSIMFAYEKITGSAGYDLLLPRGVPVLPTFAWKILIEEKYFIEAPREVQLLLVTTIPNVSTSLTDYGLRQIANEHKVLMYLCKLRAGTLSMIQNPDVLFDPDGAAAACMYLLECAVLGVEPNVAYCPTILIRMLSCVSNRDARAMLLTALICKQYYVIDSFSSECAKALAVLKQLCITDNVSDMMGLLMMWLDESPLQFSIATDVPSHIRKASGLYHSIGVGELAMSLTRVVGGLQQTLGTILPNVFARIITPLPDEKLDVGQVAETTLHLIHLLLSFIEGDVRIVKCAQMPRNEALMQATGVSTDEDICSAYPCLHTLMSRNYLEWNHKTAQFLIGIIRLAYPVDVIELVLYDSMLYDKWYDGVQKMPRNLFTLAKVAVQVFSYLLNVFCKQLWEGHRVMNTEFMRIISCALLICHHHDLPDMEAAVTNFLKSYVTLGDLGVQNFVFNWFSLNFQHNEDTISILLKIYREIMPADYFEIGFRDVIFNIVRGPKPPPMLPANVTVSALDAHEKLQLSFSVLTKVPRAPWSRAVRESMYDDSQKLRIAGEPLDHDSQYRNIPVNERYFLSATISISNYSPSSASSDIKLRKLADDVRVYSSNTTGGPLDISSNDALTYDIVDQLLWKHIKQAHSIEFYHVIRNSAIAVEAIGSFLDSVLLIATESNNFQLVASAVACLDLMKIWPVEGLLLGKLTSLCEPGRNNEEDLCLILRSLSLLLHVSRCGVKNPTAVLNTLVAVLNSIPSIPGKLSTLCATTILEELCLIGYMENRSGQFALHAKMREIITKCQLLISAGPRLETSNLMAALSALSALAAHPSLRALFVYCVPEAALDSWIGKNSSTSLDVAYQTLCSDGNMSLLDRWGSIFTDLETTIMEEYSSLSSIHKYLLSDGSACIGDLLTTSSRPYLHSSEVDISRVVSLTSTNNKLSTIGTMEQLMPVAETWLATPFIESHGKEDHHSASITNGPFGLVKKFVTPLIIPDEDVEDADNSSGVGPGGMPRRAASMKLKKMREDEWATQGREGAADMPDLPADESLILPPKTVTDGFPMGPAPPPPHAFVKSCGVPLAAPPPPGPGVFFGDPMSPVPITSPAAAPPVHHPPPMAEVQAVIESPAPEQLTVDESDPIIQQFYRVPGFYDLIQDCAAHGIEFISLINNPVVLQSDNSLRARFIEIVRRHPASHSTLEQANFPL